MGLSYLLTTKKTKIENNNNLFFKKKYLEVFKIVCYRLKPEKESIKQSWKQSMHLIGIKMPNHNKNNDI